MVVGVILEAMQKNSTVAEVQENGCFVLASLAASIEEMSATVATLKSEIEALSAEIAVPRTAAVSLSFVLVMRPRETLRV